MITPIHTQPHPHDIFCSLGPHCTETFILPFTQEKKLSGTKILFPITHETLLTWPLVESYQISLTY